MTLDGLQVILIGMKPGYQIWLKKWTHVQGDTSDVQCVLQSILIHAASCHGENTRCPITLK